MQAQQDHQQATPLQKPLLHMESVGYIPIWRDDSLYRTFYKFSACDAHHTFTGSHEYGDWFLETGAVKAHGANVFSFACASLSQFSFFLYEHYVYVRISVDMYICRMSVQIQMKLEYFLVGCHFTCRWNYEQDWESCVLTMKRIYNRVCTEKKIDKENLNYDCFQEHMNTYRTHTCVTIHSIYRTDK